MNRRIRSSIPLIGKMVVILAAASLIIGASGCTAFRPQVAKPEAPQTVEDWMEQPRVQP